MTERLIDGRFALAESLGSGGMGTVWRAHDQLLGRKVALKEVRLPANLASAERDSVRERVIREARAAAKLSHASAVTVFDVIEEEDNIFIAMELVESPTLAQIVESEGPFSPDRAARTGLAVLGALEAAHAAGIVHRDVKPANIMVGAEDRIKLADFGIASIKGDPRLTATGMVIGSPSFMAPEQASGKEAGPASDMWGLGATLFFATEGVGPFDREGPMPTLMAITSEEAPAAVHAGPLQAAIGLLLSKEPGLRPSAAELRPVLLKATGSHPRPGPAVTMRDTPLMNDTLETQEPPTPRRAPVMVQPAEPDHEVMGRAVAPAAPVYAEPAAAPPSTANRWAIPAFMVALLLLGIFLVPRLFDQPDTTGTTVTEQTAGATAATTPNSTGPPATVPTTRVPDRQVAPAELPANWASQPLGDTGYRVGRPETWSVVENPLRDGNSTRFNGPDGRYLLVDWTDKPGKDAAAAWEQSAASFARRRQNYRQIQITPTEFQDFDTAALWEWTYTSGGAELHAANLGFADDEWGFALNFQTRSQDWDAAQPIFEQFQKTFGTDGGSDQ